MKIIATDGAVSLVEYVGPAGTTRVVVPAGQEQNGPALLAGIPWGADWGGLRLPPPDSEALARELRRVGLWTAADVRAHPREAHSALQRACGNIVAAFFAMIEEVHNVK